tara:strand:+ start:285 stop:443 length:159 start_codon:yes stop_codon:yes gene_type:complete
LINYDFPFIYKVYKITNFTIHFLLHLPLFINKNLQIGKNVNKVNNEKGKKEI